jgi:hypothetical protein
MRITRMQECFEKSLLFFYGCKYNSDSYTIIKTFLYGTLHGNEKNNNNGVLCGSGLLSGSGNEGA